MPLKFEDNIENNASGFVAVDATANNVGGLYFVADTTERDALGNADSNLGDIRKQYCLVNIAGEIYTYTSDQIDDTSWTNADNWTAVGGSGGAESAQYVTAVAAYNISGANRVLHLFSSSDEEDFPTVYSGGAKTERETAPRIVGVSTTTANRGDEITMLTYGPVYGARGIGNTEDRAIKFGDPVYVSIESDYVLGSRPAGGIQVGYALKHNPSTYELDYFFTGVNNSIYPDSTQQHESLRYPTTLEEPDVAYAVGTVFKNTGTTYGFSPKSDVYTQGIDDPSTIVGIGTTPLSSAAWWDKLTVSLVQQGLAMIDLEENSKVWSAGDPLYIANGGNTITTDSASGEQVGELLVASSDSRYNVLFPVICSGVPNDGETITIGDSGDITFVTTSTNAQNEINISNMTDGWQVLDMLAAMIVASRTTSGVYTTNVTSEAGDTVTGTCYIASAFGDHFNDAGWTMYAGNGDGSFRSYGVGREGNGETFTSTTSVFTFGYDEETTYVTDTGENMWLVWIDIPRYLYSSGGGASTLDELADVDTSTTAPTDGQALIYNDTDSEWQPTDIETERVTINCIASGTVFRGAAVYHAGVDSATGKTLVKTTINPSTSQAPQWQSFIGVSDYNNGNISNGQELEVVVRGEVTAFSYYTDRDVVAGSSTTWTEGMPLYIHPRYVYSISSNDASALRVAHLVDPEPIDTYYRKIYIDPNATGVYYDGIPFELSERQPVFFDGVGFPVNTLVQLNSTLDAQALGIHASEWTEGTDDILNLVGVTTGRADSNSITNAVSQGQAIITLPEEDLPIGAPIYIGAGTSKLTGDPDSSSGILVGYVTDLQAILAEARITFTAVPADGESININGIDYYFVLGVDSGNARNEIDITGLTTAEEVVTLTGFAVYYSRNATGSFTGGYTGNAIYIETENNIVSNADFNDDVLTIISNKGLAGNIYTASSSSSVATVESFDDLLTGRNYYRAYLDFATAKASYSLSENQTVIVNSLPASATVEFLNNPTDGDTLTIDGTAITFVDTLSGSGDEVEIQYSSGATAQSLNFYLNNAAGITTINKESDIPVFSYFVVGNNDALNIVAREVGTAGNSITLATSNPTNISLSASTLSEGTDTTPNVNTRGNQYIKGVATKTLQHGSPVFIMGYDPETGYPLATNDVREFQGFRSADSPAHISPAGIAVNVDGGSIQPGDTFSICTYGVVYGISMYYNEVTGAQPSIGTALSTGVSGANFVEDDGSGIVIATVLQPSTSWNTSDGIVFFFGGIDSPYTRLTLDGVARENTTRVQVTTVEAITGGSIVVHNKTQGGNFREVGQVRHYTNSDDISDIMGIASTSRTATTTWGLGVCTQGLVGGVTLYNASGSVITTGANILGATVYAGDGITNPSHVLTTDPSSGVAIGTVQQNDFQGVIPIDTWIIFVKRELFYSSLTTTIANSLPASTEVTFSANPTNGDTLTIDGTVITFRTLPLTGSGEEVRIDSSAANTARNFMYFLNNQKDVNADFVTKETALPVYGYREPTNSSTIKVIAQNVGTAGNSITISTSNPTAIVIENNNTTLVNGTNSDPVVSTRGNQYIKAVAGDNFSHGNLAYFAGWDPDTGYPLVFDANKPSLGVSTDGHASIFSPVGVAVDLGATSFNTIKAGDIVDICTYGIIDGAWMYDDGVTGGIPITGQTLSAGTDGTGFVADDGTGAPVATVIQPPSGQFTLDGIFFFYGGWGSPYTRPTLDGVMRENTVRIPVTAAFGSSAIDAGSLVVHDGNENGNSRNIAGYRHYTSSDANLDIVGIAAKSITIGGNVADTASVCVQGLVSRITLYDNSGSVITTGTANIIGATVYAGDGTTNASHLLTTDSTSGVAVGIVQQSDYHGAIKPDTWTILFQPHRL